MDKMEFTRTLYARIGKMFSIKEELYFNDNGFSCHITNRNSKYYSKSNDILKDCSYILGVVGQIITDCYTDCYNETLSTKDFSSGRWTEFIDSNGVIIRVKYENGVLEITLN